jgi:endoglucanase
VALECDKRRIPFVEDRFGNLWLGAKTLAEARGSKLTFVAHMDHPGFLVDRFEIKSGRGHASVRVHAHWQGGGPKNKKRMLQHPVKVFSHFHGLLIFDGRIVECVEGPRSLTKAVIELDVPHMDDLFSPSAIKKLGPWGACLWYDCGGLSFEGDRVRTKAADDLVGVCTLIAALEKSKCPKGVTALITRAEESGFHGTMAVLENRFLKPERTTMVSLETSAQLPGAMSRGGPVVRLGDRSTVFNPAAVRWVQDTASHLSGGLPPGGLPATQTLSMTAMKKARKGGKSAARAAKGHIPFAYQRRVMDGGSCEASAFNAYGFTVAGVSVPLIGYHNVGPDSAPVPEEVSLHDVARTVDLMVALMEGSKTLSKGGATKPAAFHLAAFASFRKDIAANYRKHLKFF